MSRWGKTLLQNPEVVHSGSAVAFGRETTFRDDGDACVEAGWENPGLQFQTASVGLEDRDAVNAAFADHGVEVVADEALASVAVKWVDPYGYESGPGNSR